MQGQGSDPFLGLLGFFILCTTFFFCGEWALTSPPPVAVEHPAEVPSSAPNIIDPPSSPPVSPVATPTGLNKTFGDSLMGPTMMLRINSAMLPPEGNLVLNRAATLVQEVPTVVFAVGWQTDNVGAGDAKQVLAEQRANPVVESVTTKGSTTSGNWKCWLWTVVGASLLGWGIKGMVLGPVMDEKRREVERLMSKVTLLTNRPPEVRTVEKRVEVPVERVVLKRIEVPVEKVVVRPIEDREQLVRIKALEDEVAVIAELRAQIAQLQAVASQVGGRSIEERVVVPVDNPEQLARIKALEDEVAVIAELRTQIAQLQATSSQAEEGSVEKQTEAPAEQRVEKNGDMSVETISTSAGGLDRTGAVEPSDEGQAVGELPDDLKQIRGVGPALERFLHKRGVFWFSQVATWNQADIDKFEFLLPNFGGRIQRENWMQSAKVEHYKKYKKWLGNDEPPSTTPDMS
jgi:predicted flap endonuclease-1-like 5' DNA nuclease